MNVPPDLREPTLWQAAGHGFEQLFRSAPGHDVIHVPGGMLALTGVSAPDLNCGVVWDASDAAASIGHLADALCRRDLPGLLLVADSAGLEAGCDVADPGMIAAARMPLMMRAPGPLAADPRFTVRRVTMPRDLESANRVISEAFELPAPLVDAAFRPSLLDSEDVTLEMVLDGEEPVGCLQTTSHDGLVGIWSMATPPALRRRGIARAGLTHALADRFAAGASAAFLIATDAGRPLYDALGFQVVAWCTAWLVPRRERRP